MAAASPPLPVVSSPRIIPRSVNPQKELKQNDTSISNVLPAEAEFRQLIGSAMSGSVARFVGNELFVIFWHRTTIRPELIFGAEINLNEFTNEFERLILPDYDLTKTVCVGLLDDKGKPVVTTTPGFSANWKWPFVATEVGEVLPHWEIGVYLLNPAAANQIATAVQRSVGAAIVLLLAAIGIGSWLIWRDLGRQVHLARQKTDFVSNVSHELKTPLTSIRIFSELLANNPDPERQNCERIIAFDATDQQRTRFRAHGSRRNQIRKRSLRFERTGPCDTGEFQTEFRLGGGRFEPASGVW